MITMQYTVRINWNVFRKSFLPVYFIESVEDSNRHADRDYNSQGSRDTTYAS